MSEVLNEVASNVRANAAFLRSIERSYVIAAVYNLLAVGVCCLKHEGFVEEEEWRVIYAPKRVSSDSSLEGRL